MKLTIPFVSISIIAAAILSIGLVTCKLSFAENKRPDKGSVTFGLSNKPDIKTSPQFESFKTVFADIAEKVVPTVVAIKITKIDTIVYYQNPFFRYFGDDQFGDDENSPFGQFFNVPPQQQHRGRQGQPPQQKPQTHKRSAGVGSGVIVSKDGYVLTNFHVVNGADEIEVKLADDRTFKAKVIGSDSLSDIAVIKIEGDIKNLPVVYLGESSKLRVGEWVLAVGTPFNLSSTVTTGIVSALSRKVSESGQRGPLFQNFIQTDAAINPGNSGGALVNLDGELVGINTMIFSTSGGFMGIGFAVPIDLARRVMEDLIYEGKVNRGMIGLLPQDLTNATRESMGLPSDQKGAIVASVSPNLPAEKAGLKRYDIITAIGTVPVKNAENLRNIVADLKPGTKVPFDIIRNGKKIKIEITIALRDEKVINAKSGGKGQSDNNSDSPQESNTDIGITVSALSNDIRDQLGIDNSIGGVVVRDIDQSSSAAESGIRKGDIIMEVNRQSVTSVGDYHKIIKQIKNGQSVLLVIFREGSAFFVAFKVANTN